MKVYNRHWNDPFKSPHSLPCNCLLNAAVNPENIRLNLTLTPVSASASASTEWSRNLIPVVGLWQPVCVANVSVGRCLCRQP